MNTIELYDYQSEAVRLAQTALHQKHKVLVVSPGGSGKTVMIGQQGAEALAEKKRVLIISHRKEIIDHTRRTLVRLGIASDSVGVVMGAETSNEDAPVVVASMMTLIRRKRPLPADVVIVDEAHHALADGYAAVLARYPEARHTGYTATPFRMDGRGLGDFYTHMITAAKPSALIERNLLAKPLIYRAPVDFMPTLTRLKIARGDYAIDALAPRVLERKLVGNIVENWKNRAEGKLTIAFAVSVEHSQHIVANFRAHSVPAAHVDGSMSSGEREQILEDFAARKILVLSNCMILSEGFDLPTCEAVILARPTLSLALYIQQANRATRTSVGKQRALLLDHGRLLENFGMPEADREYILTTGKMSSAVGNAGPVKDCPSCGVTVAAGTACCPYCGHVFPNMVRGIPTESDVALEPWLERARVEMEQRIRKQYGDTPKAQEMMKIWTGFNIPLRAVARP